MDKVFLAVPTHNGLLTEGTVLGLLNPIEKDSKTDLIIRISTSSNLTGNFNRLWCEAFNDKTYTHFLMLHADIAPEYGFVDKMLSIMKRVGADVLSAISPLKNDFGLTSTALAPESPMGRITRYTMQQVFKEEPTFTHPRLLLNTGLMLVNMKIPKADLLHFNTKSWIENESGRAVEKSLTEDWAFSDLARVYGAKLYATREVKLEHLGTMRYPNHYPWGRLPVDRPEV